MKIRLLALGLLATTASVASGPDGQRIGELTSGIVRRRWPVASNGGS